MELPYFTSVLFDDICNYSLKKAIDHIINRHLNSLAMSTKTKPQADPTPFIDPELQGDESDTDTTKEPTAYTIESFKAEIAEKKAGGAERIRYSDEQINFVLNWAASYDEEHNGRGGASKVAELLNISPLSISGWKKKNSSEPREVKTRTRTPKAAEPEQVENSTVSLLRIIRGRGWEVSGSRDIFNVDAPVIYDTEAKIKPLLAYADNFTREGKFSLSYDELCTILKLPLNK